MTVIEERPAAEQSPVQDHLRIVTVRIRRFDPEVDPDAYWQDFEVPVEKGDRLLDALRQIKGYQDGSLTFRSSCAHGVCGSDAMRINGVNRLACKVLVKDLGDTILVEPIKGLPALKDLIVDMEPFFEAYRAVKPFLITDGREPTRERLQSAEDRERFDDTTKCIMCAPARRRARCSGTTRPTSGRRPSSWPTASSSTAATRAPRSGSRSSTTKEGVWRCRTTFNCTDACPRGIEVTKAIQEVKRALIFRRV
jgi:succinate dehydrogenase / fumarate reductase iron-sulfur subunit